MSGRRQMRMRSAHSRWACRVVLLVVGTTPHTVDSDPIKVWYAKWAGTVLDVDVEALRQEVAVSYDRMSLRRAALRPLSRAAPRAEIPV